MSLSNNKFSVLMSLYDGENNSYFNESMVSIWETTSLRPDEIILVLDGHIRTELMSSITYWRDRIHCLSVIKISENVGLGEALRVGLLACQFPLVARMDTDDISTNDRFEKQIIFLERNPNIDVVGSWIAEFESNKNSITGLRKVPEKHNDLVSFAQWRDPVNHMTVMFRKRSVLEAGNYEHHLWFEDTWLWARMLRNGSIFHNIQEPLVFARAGSNMFSRRRGFKYLRSEILLLKKLKKIDFISNNVLLTNLIIRTPIRLLPQPVLEFFFKKLLRSRS